MAKSDPGEAAAIAKVAAEVDAANPDLVKDVLNRVRISDDELLHVDNVADVEALFAAQGFDIPDAPETLGAGFQVEKDKDKLVNVGFILLDWRFTPGEYGNLFAVARLLTKEQPSKKYIITDGSTGIRDQLLAESKRRLDRGMPHVNAGWNVPRGLTKSEYTYTDPSTGKESPGVTYYLSAAV